jgi:hypothetical protein
VHISSQGGQNNTYAVTWAESAGASNAAIVLQAFDRNANALGSKLTVQTTSLTTTRLGRPDVDGDGKRFALAWDQDSVSSGVAALLRGATYDFNPLLGALVQGVAPKTLVTGPLSTDLGLIGTSVAWTPEGVIIGSSEYSGFDASSAAYDGFLRHFDSGSLNQLEGPIDVVGFVYSLVASQLSGSDAATIVDSNTADEAILPSFDGAAGGLFGSDAGILRVRRFTSPGRTQELGGGCGKGGFAWANGAIVGKTLGLHLDTDQISGTSYALIGQSFGGLSCGSCSLLVGSGNASVAVNVPSNSALSGVGVTVQWATPVFAPLCSVLSCDFSNAIRVTLE